MQQKILKNLDEFLSELKKYKKIFLVHGKSFEKYNIKNDLANLNCIEFMDFSSNPLYEDVCKGIELFNKENCDVIVAIGGGSAIDVAKCIKLFSKMDKSNNYLKQERFDSGIPLIAVPTTAGTGSESTRHSVIYYKGVKQSVSHESIIPNMAVLLPDFLLGLPIYQKKCTMLDALCQSIESWWSVSSTNESKEYSKLSIELIKNNWVDYIENNTFDSAEKMLEAANLSGKAINITATTSAHAMSYKLTSMYRLPHGHAVALCMMVVWQYMKENIDRGIDKRGVEYISEVFVDISDAISYDYFLEMMSQLGMDEFTQKYTKEDIDSLAKSVNLERLKNNPILLTEDILKGMYERILD